MKLTSTAGHYEYGDVKSEDFNIYITFNPRDVRKAWIGLQNEFSNWIGQSMFSKDDNQLLAHLRKVDGEWYSCLQQEKARARQQYFMIDVDTKDDDAFNGVVDELGNLLVYAQETRHGYHILTNVKDYPYGRKWMFMSNPKIEFKRDSLFFLGAVDSKLGGQ